MADYTFAIITISGSLPESSLDSFVHILFSECLAPDYDGYETEADLAAYIRKTSGPLVLKALEAENGEFPMVEYYCQRNGLAYTRADDGHSTWTATVTRWEPGMADPKVWTGSVDTYVPHLSAEEIRAHLAAGSLDAELSMMEQALKPTAPFLLVPAA